MKIELTNEIVKVIEFCPHLEKTPFEICVNYCPLMGACIEYWTGDDSKNKETD